MATHALPHRSAVKANRSLASRGGATRTFSSLTAFLALLFLVCGLYLIGDALAHSVTAHDAGVLAGACTIALASILLFYLLKPNPSRRLTGEDGRSARRG